MSWFRRQRDCGCAHRLKAIEESLDALTGGIVMQLVRVNKNLDELIQVLKRGSAPPVALHLSAGPELPKENPMFPVELTSEGKKVVTLNPRTVGGNPAQLDGPPTIEVLSGDSTFNILDNTHFEAISANSPGITLALLRADADLGAGVIEIQETIEVTVTDPRAVNLGLEAGPEVPK